MSLEERRAERRRKRQMEEDSQFGLSAEDLEAAELRSRLEQRRREREDRRAQQIASSVVQVNGEDDLERRRRERREQRLRGAGGEAPTEDRRERRRRNRDEEEDTSAVSAFATEEDTPDTSSFSASRRKNYWEDEEEETPTVNDTGAADTSAQEEQRRREEEEAQSRRQAEAEAEEERRREAKRREEEEDSRRAEEQERRRGEQRRKEHDLDVELRIVEEPSDSDSESHHSENSTPSNLDTDTTEVNNNKLDSVRKWTQDNAEFHGTEEKLKELKITEEVDIAHSKVKDKLNKFEHLKEAGDRKEKTPPKVLERGNSTLKEKVNRFEKEVQEQTAAARDQERNVPSQRVKESPAVVTGGNKLKAKLQQLESSVQSQHTPRSSRTVQLAPRGTVSERQAMLGRWSASESRINRQDSKENPSRSVADRWKRAVDTPKTKPLSPTLRSPAKNKNNPEILSKRLSGNTEFIASRFILKSKTLPDESVSPSTHSLVSERRSVYQNGSRSISQSSETLSDYSDKLSDRLSYHEPGTRSKVADRWKPAMDVTSTPKSGRTSSSGIHSRGSSFDDSTVHSRRSSYDASSDTSKGPKSPEPTSSGPSTPGPKSPPFCRDSQLEQEEEARLEAERLEEEQLQKEEEDRMAAEEEKKKKKGKRKGLGGLSPEKKKKLKETLEDSDVYLDDQKLNVLCERMQCLPDDFDSYTEASTAATVYGPPAPKKDLRTLAQISDPKPPAHQRSDIGSCSRLADAELKELCKKLHKKVAQLESDVYDWEMKIANQDQEVQELTIKVNDSTGKFVKPVLRKVNKTERKFAKLQHAKEKADFRENLKSSGQNKFEMDEDQQEQAAE